MNKTTPQPRRVYAVFCGPVNEGTIRTAIHWLAIPTQSTQNQEPVRELHLAFQSSGGTVADAVFMYEFLRAYPIPLTIYNMGTVQSAGTIIFLGASRRVACQHSTFMLHRSAHTMPPATAVALKSLAKSVGIDDARMEAILKTHVQLSEDNWSDLRNHEFWFTAEDAVASGLATEIGAFTPPTGSPLYSLNAT